MAIPGAIRKPPAETGVSTTALRVAGAPNPSTTIQASRDRIYWLFDAVGSAPHRIGEVAQFVDDLPNSRLGKSTEFPSNVPHRINA